jgi:hypothetical protein
VSSVPLLGDSSMILEREETMAQKGTGMGQHRRQCSLMVLSMQLACLDAFHFAGLCTDTQCPVSPYSYFAFLYLRKQREVLASHGVEVEYVLPLG